MEEIAERAGKVKRKAAMFLEEAVEKLAKLLGRDPDTVRAELEAFWKRISEGAIDWAEDVLGRARAVSTWTTWLDIATTSPGQGSHLHRP